jgi:short-subunit dehydrogenase
VGAYCASKAAVLAIGETLLAELKGKGVSCTVIHPGFVESKIARMDNEGQFHPEKEDPRPANLMWPTEKAARRMMRAMEDRKQVFVFTMYGKVGILMSRLFPGVLRKMDTGKTP